MTTATEKNWLYLSVCVRDAARDVLARRLTIEEAATQYDVPAEWIEHKCLDADFEPPKTTKQPETILDRLRKAPAPPRDVLTAEEKALKGTFIDPLQKRRVWTMFLVCLGQAANEVSHNILTLRAACEKYDVSAEDVQRRIKDPAYEPSKPLPPGAKLVEDKPNRYVFGK